MEGGLPDLDSSHMAWNSTVCRECLLQASTQRSRQCMVKRTSCMDMSDFLSNMSTMGVFEGFDIWEEHLGRSPICKRSLSVLFPLSRFRTWRA